MNAEVDLINLVFYYDFNGDTLIPIIIEEAGVKRANIVLTLQLACL